jgi:hypothetical protein
VRPRRVRDDHDRPTVLALIFAAAIPGQPIQTSANTRSHGHPGKPPGNSHAFSHCENQPETPAGLRIETRNRRLGSHFTEKFAEILHPESVNPA